MARYFYIHFKDDDGCIAQTSLDYKYPEYTDTIAQDFLFEVDKLPQDYLGNDHGWPMMSERMTKTIEMASDPEDVKWANINISILNQGPSKHNLLYHIPVFRCDPDVLDLEKTIYAKGNDSVVVKAHFSLKKISGRRFFNIPNSHVRLVVDEALKEDLEAMSLSGLDFSRCLVS